MSDPAPDLDIMARKLALRHIASHVRRGFSEAYLSSFPLEFISNGVKDDFGAYDISIGGWISASRRVGTDHVLVHRVCGVEVDKVYSLHELYVECQSKQMSLL